MSASLTDADCQKPAKALDDDLSTIEDDDSPGWRCSTFWDLFWTCSFAACCC